MATMSYQSSLLEKHMFSRARGGAGKGDEPPITAEGLSSDQWQTVTDRLGMSDQYTIVATEVQVPKNQKRARFAYLQLPGPPRYNAMFFIILIVLALLAALAITVYVTVIRQVHLDARLFLIIPSVIAIILLILGGLFALGFWRQHPSMWSVHKLVVITPVAMLMLLVFPFLNIHSITEAHQYVQWGHNHDDDLQFVMASALIINIFFLAAVLVPRSLYLVSRPTEAAENTMGIMLNNDQVQSVLSQTIARKVASAT
jgi:hypothetical protein